MSRGKPRIFVRFAPEKIAEIKGVIDRLRFTSAYPPWDFSDFIRTCVQEKLQKMERSRKSRKKKRTYLKI